MKSFSDNDNNKLIIKEELMRELFDKYADRLGRYVFKNGVKAADVQEVVCEVFIRLFKKANKFDLNKGNLEAYIFMLAKYVVYDYYKDKHKYYDNIIFVEENDSLGNLFKINSDKKKTHNLASLINEMGERLTPYEHDIVILKYLYNTEVSSVCETLGISFYKYHKFLESAYKKIINYINYYGYEL